MLYLVILIIFPLFKLFIFVFALLILISFSLQFSIFIFIILFFIGEFGEFLFLFNSKFLFSIELIIIILLSFFFNWFDLYEPLNDSFSNKNIFLLLLVFSSFSFSFFLFSIFVLFSSGSSFSLIKSDSSKIISKLICAILLPLSSERSFFPIFIKPGVSSLELKSLFFLEDDSINSLSLFS